MNPERKDRLAVVLVSPRNPLNIGAAARAMSNFGFLRMRLVNPYEKALAGATAAVGAAQVLLDAQEFSSVADAVADCSLVVGTTAVGPRALEHPVLRLEAAAARIFEATNGGNVALLFGSEKYGLSNEDFSHCHWLLRIPTRDEHISMNLGQAVAVCLYELIRSETARAAPEPARELAGSGEVERLTAVMLDVLHESEYVTGQGSAAAEEKLRRLVRRLSVDTRDAPTLTGMFRQILWKLRNPKA